MFSKFIHLVSGLLIQPKPAAIGDIVSSISLPYKQYPISVLSESRAPSPIGLILKDEPASSTESQIFSACSDLK